VIAHYGSVAGEIAVCTKAAGLIERTDLDQVELRGRELFVDHALAAAMADGVPTYGEARCVAGVWGCRPSATRAVLAGPVRTIERWRAVIRRAVATTAITVEVDSLPRAEAVSIIGPRAQAVVEAAALPAGLAAGSVAEGRLGGSRVDVVGEELDRYLLLFCNGCSDEAWHRLGEAGRPLGLAHVGQRALDHLGARRTR
jgi:glycine cleavage system aminomethyltransferase T